MKWISCDPLAWKTMKTPRKSFVSSGVSSQKVKKMLFITFLFENSQIHRGPSSMLNDVSSRENNEFDKISVGNRCLMKSNNSQAWNLFLGRLTILLHQHRKSCRYLKNNVHFASSMKSTNKLADRLKTKFHRRRFVFLNFEAFAFSNGDILFLLFKTKVTSEWNSVKLISKVFSLGRLDDKWTFCQ